MSIPGSASPLFFQTAAAAAGADVATKSLRFNDDDAANLSRTPSSAGNRRTFTFAFWVKLCELSATGSWLSAYNGSFSDANYVQFYYAADGRIRFAGTTAWFGSSAVLRDPSAWYHVCLSVDTTLGTAADRVKVYLNGVEIEKGSGTNPSQNHEFPVNNTFPHYISTYNGSAEPFDGYLADIYMIDGSAISPVNNFIELDDNGVYQAKEYSGTFGTNGFHLSFSDATSTTTIAEDSSGNNNDWTANNISVTAGAGNDSMFDAPTNGSQSDTGAGGEVSGNYCVLNPLHRSPAGDATAKNGNLVWGGTSNNHHVIAGTFGVSSGKWYWEATYTNASSNYVGIGMCEVAYLNAGGIPGYNEDNAFVIYSSAGRYYYNSTSTFAYGTGWTVGDVIGVRYDEGAVYFYKNGTIMNSSPILTLTGTWQPLFHTYDSGEWTVNFGQRSFAYTPPTDHLALVTTNLSDPTIADGSEYFDIALYTGATQSPRTITGLNIAEPDFVWVKNRSAAYPHLVWDAVRGTDKNLNTTLTAHESDVSGASQGIISTSASNGFVVKNGSSGGLNVGSSGSNSYVAWCWEAGSSTVSNTDGSITSNVRANQTAGFSIVTYTGNATNGATVGHGLNAAPDLIIIKNRDDSGTYWVTYHSALGGTKALALNLTDSVLTNSLPFNNTNPTSSVFTVGAGGSFSYSNNQSGESHVAYCFAPVAGYSAFGSYVGTGTSDNSAPFVYTGFRPAFVLIKNSSAAANWMLYDTARNPSNEAPYVLGPNNSDGGLTYDAYSGSYPIDILSNGFKPRSTLSNINGSGNTLVYACFSEHPFKTARAR